MSNEKPTSGLPPEALKETASLIEDIEVLIGDRIKDLQTLRALARAVAANASKDDLRPHILGLARSSRAAYISLRGTRDRLVRLQGREEDDRSLSRTDLLTGLPNLAALTDVLERDSELENQALLIVDMSGIRVVAEELGVRLARRIMIRAATILRGAVKERDIVSRSGPNQFAVLLTKVAPGKGAMVAVRLYDMLAQRLSPSGANVVDALMLSVGLAIRNPSDDGLKVLARAQHAASAAKTLAPPRINVL